MPIHENHTYSKLAYILILLLVIVIILSIIVAYKIHRNNYLQNRYNKKIAFTLVDDITNKMNINYKELAQGTNNLYFTDNPKQPITVQQNANYLCHTTNEGCAPLSIAANDILNWQSAIKNNLLNGTGTIFWLPADNSINIQISWNTSKTKPQTTIISKKIVTYQNYYDNN